MLAPRVQRKMLKDQVHPNYRYGGRAKGAIRQFSEKMLELQELTIIARAVGVEDGLDRTGRKLSCAD